MTPTAIIRAASRLAACMALMLAVFALPPSAAHAGVSHGVSHGGAVVSQAKHSVTHAVADPAAAHHAHTTACPEGADAADAPDAGAPGAKTAGDCCTAVCAAAVLPAFRAPGEVTLRPAHLSGTVAVLVALGHIEFDRPPNA